MCCFSRRHKPQKKRFNAIQKAFHLSEEADVLTEGVGKLDPQNIKIEINTTPWRVSSLCFPLC